MICFECALSGESSEAVAFCHHCSAALCLTHALTVDDPVTAAYPLGKTLVLPKHARLILCGVCRTALCQPRETKFLVK